MHLNKHQTLVLLKEGHVIKEGLNTLTINSEQYSFIIPHLVLRALKSSSTVTFDEASLPLTRYKLNIHHHHELS